MRGDGLYKIPKSRFWYYKLKENGRWRGISTKTTSYAVAKRIRQKTLQDQEEGRLPEGEISRCPFERAACFYLQKASTRLRPNSIKKEISFLMRPKKLFGQVACGAITPMHIQQLQVEMKNDGCKNTYNNLVVGVTMRVLRFAKVWRRIRDDVTRVSERDNKPVARVMKAEEKKRLFEVARSNPNWATAYAAALIAASTSARGADLRILRWSDIDLFEGVMGIPDSKSEAGKRRLPLMPDAALGFRILLERAEKLGVNAPRFYVFPACENNHIDGTRPQKTWRTSWRNLTRAAGLKGLRFHDLRHQCITELLESGATEAAVLSIAGHVSRKMMEHYSHIRMEAKRIALEGLTPITTTQSEPVPSAHRVN
ncbi:MAG: site-specific integrase [Candidatus Acidiferrales bacterium]